MTKLSDVYSPRLCCRVPPSPRIGLIERLVGDTLRNRLIRRLRTKWAKGTTITYFQYAWNRIGESGAQNNRDREVVRKAFQHWHDLGINLDFQEVMDPEEAMCRIDFKDDGSWSYVGTDCLEIDKTEPTMNFGWSLTDSWGWETVLHEIGHLMGFPHEHQNPKAGIIWDEQAVIEEFSGPPNYWSESTIRHNILNKIPEAAIEGSDWDPDSIMHYHFGPGLVNRPFQYKTAGINPAPGLSEIDQQKAREFFPGEGTDGEPIEYDSLPQYQPVLLDDNPGTDRLFEFTAEKSGFHNIGTFGNADTLLILRKEGIQIKADDDSGWDHNARIKKWLSKDRAYTVVVRIVWRSEEPLILMRW